MAKYMRGAEQMMLIHINVEEEKENEALIRNGSMQSVYARVEKRKKRFRFNCQANCSSKEISAVPSGAIDKIK